MIYALVEPSIYMIASILPTTRHLYRRLRRNYLPSLLSSHSQRTGNSDSHQKNSDVTRSADSKKITRNTDIWQATNVTSESEEGLTLGQWYAGQQEWRQMDDLEGKSGTQQRESVKGSAEAGVRPGTAV
jgi:hypothetical protein